MTLEMRELRGDDLFSLLAIIGKLDIKDEFISMFEANVESETKAKLVLLDHQDKKLSKKDQEAAEKAQEANQIKAEAVDQKRGAVAMATILQKALLNIKAIKTDLNSLLADLTSKTVKDIEELSLKEYTALVIAFFRKPELADFFSSIASLLK